MSAQRRLSNLIILTLVLIPATSSAVVMSWQECVDMAARQNPDIAAAAALVRSNDALVLGSWSGFMPQLSANIGVTENSVNGGAASVNPTTGITSIASTSSQTQWTEALQATQSIFNGFSDVGKIRQARANLLASKAALDVAKVTVAANLKTAFAELLFEQQSIELNAQILKRQQNNLRMVTLHYEGGSENRGNQLYQAASVTQAQYQYDHSVRQVRNGARQLAALLGDPDLRDLRVRGDFKVNVPAVIPDFNQIAAQNPNHTEAVATQVAADAAVEVANGNWYPNLNAVGSLSRNGPEYPPNTSRWSVGLSLTFPFFPGTTTIANANSARALERQASALISSTDVKLIAALEAAYAGLLDAVGQVKVAEDFAVGAKARSVIADGKYNTGLMAFEDWTVIDTDNTTRQQNLLTNLRNALQAEATWETAEGVGAIK